MATNGLVNDYRRRSNQLVNNLVFLKNNAQRVYRSDDLKRRYNVSYANEFAAINRYSSERAKSKDSKIANLRALQNQELNLGQSDLIFIKDAVSKYDDEFNENLKKMNYIDKEIMTKEKLIEINDDEVIGKDRFIKILNNIVLYMFLMFLPILLAKMNIIPLSLALIVIVISFIITLVVTVIQYYRSKDVDILKRTKDTASQFTRDAIGDIGSKLDLVQKCPDKCQPKKLHSNEAMNKMMKELDKDYQVFSSGQGNEVWLDDSRDKRIEGDIPDIGGGNKDGYLKISKGAMPRPFYNGAMPSKIYTCKWTSDPKNMTNMNKGAEFSTTTPCEYYPGYRTVMAKDIENFE